MAEKPSHILAEVLSGLWAYKGCRLVPTLHQLQRIIPTRKKQKVTLKSKQERAPAEVSFC